MMKKVLAAVLALSVFSVSASTLPAELGNLKDLESKLIEQGVDVESFKKSARELNLDPTLTEMETAEVIADFTRSYLETGAAYHGNVFEVSKWAAVAFFVLGFAARFNDEKARGKAYLGMGAIATMVLFLCKERACEVVEE